MRHASSCQPVVESEDRAAIAILLERTQLSAGTHVRSNRDYRKVGGTVAQTLLATGKKVRAVVRDDAKGRHWADKGCEVAIASIGDANALTTDDHRTALALQRGSA
jgi:hypothetical protein